MINSNLIFFNPDHHHGFSSDWEGRIEEAEMEEHALPSRQPLTMNAPPDLSHDMFPKESYYDKSALPSRQPLTMNAPPDLLSHDMFPKVSYYDKS